MAKEFKIARRPGQLTSAAEPTAGTVRRRSGERKPSANSPAPPAPILSPSNGPTLRKTIEVPADYFFKVKERALQRRIKEKELWSEIVADYFDRHPEPF